MKTTKIRRSTWNTYAMSGYTHDVSGDQASAGGVHLYEVRRGPSGWQRRVRQSNGRHVSYGPVTAIDDAEGEALYARAETY